MLRLRVSFLMFKGVSQCYVWGLVSLRFGFSFLTFEG